MPGPAGEAPLTVVFDRGGWSPKLFAKLQADGIHILTYRKGNTPDLPEKKFKLRKAKLDGELVEYLAERQDREGEGRGGRP